MVKGNTIKQRPEVKVEKTKNLTQTKITPYKKVVFLKKNIID